MKTCPSCGKDILPGAQQCKHCGRALGQKKKKGYLELKAEQNLGLGILGGSIAALLGAILWALITVVNESATLIVEAISPIKSSKPGVSIMLIL